MTPNAVACYGRLHTDTHAVLRRVVEGRPVSHVTTAFLAWLCQWLTVERKRVRGRLWDHASWPRSREGRPWVRASQPPVKRHGGVRLWPWCVPSNSPWLNPIAPHGGHHQRALVEPAGRRRAAEIITRVCAYLGGAHLEHLPQRVACTCP
jgi:hypothetical protein